MELTPQLLAEVEFRDTLRGYDRDEVDTFLEQVGVAIAQLQGRLREAIARAEVAEARGPQGADDVSTETITRTLLLAQRTADATVADAEADSRRLMDQAQEESSRLRSEAEADRAAVLAETENEARQVAEQARRDLLTELADLESRREGMRLDVDALEQALAGERSRVLEAVGQLRTLVEQGVLGDEPEPARQTDDHDDEPETDSDAALLGDEPEADQTIDPIDDDVVDDDDEDTVGDATPDIDLSDDTDDDADDAADVVRAEDDLDDASGPPLGGHDTTPASDPPAGASVFGEGTGPATQAVDVLAIDDEADETDDVFVQQLRDAVSPAGEGDGETLAEFFDDDGAPRRLFGRNSE